MSFRFPFAALAALLLLAPLAPALPLPPSPPSIALDLVASGFSSPLLVTHADDGSGRVFVVQQRGLVRVVGDPTPYLDIRHKVSQSGNERGLLGLAFDPDFKTNGRLFASYTNAAGTSILERYQVANPATDRPNGNGGTIILTQTQPFSNHNGGHIAFGPDGYLYFALGDGGSADDPQNNGINLNTLLGKLLRLDVSGPGYAIPSSNPFASGGGRAEIWAYGLRNPWRFSFDRGTGDLYIADVGQNLIEEVNFQAANAEGGQHYGWDEWEGSLPHVPGSFPNPAGRTFPVLEYQHQPHCSVTGGHVYRGVAHPSLTGWYFYGDFCSGVVWAARQWNGAWTSSQRLDTSHFISSFGEDEAGELYLVSLSGSVYRVRAA